MSDSNEPGFWDDEEAASDQEGEKGEAGIRGAIDGPAETPPIKAPPPVELSNEERARLAAAITAQQSGQLMEQITRLYQRVETELSDSPTYAPYAQALLAEARTLLLARPEAFPTAELRVQQVRLLLERVKTGRVRLGPQIRSLGRLAIFWLVLFALLFALDGPIARLLDSYGWLSLPDGGPVTLSWLFPPWLPLLVGGIGGALGGLVLLGTQQNRYEFDPSSTLDYQLNAPKGAIWGVVTFYLVLAGFITTSVITAQGGELLSTAEQVRAANSPLMLILAFLAGFAQPRLMRVLRRVWGDITGDKEQEAVLPATPSAPIVVVPPSGEPGAVVSPSGETRYPVGPTHQKPRPE